MADRNSPRLDRLAIMFKELLTNGASHEKLMEVSGTGRAPVEHFIIALKKHDVLEISDLTEDKRGRKQIKWYRLKNLAPVRRSITTQWRPTLGSKP